MCVCVVLDTGHAADIFCTSAGTQCWLKPPCQRPLPGAKGERCPEERETETWTVSRRYEGVVRQTTLCKETDYLPNGAKHVSTVVENEPSVFTPSVLLLCSCSESVSDQFFGLFLIFRL